MFEVTLQMIKICKNQATEGESDNIAVPILLQMHSVNRD